MHGIDGGRLDKLEAKPAAYPTLQDQKMLARWKDLANLSSEEQERILFVMDSLIRDAKARKTYAA